ncbi:MAG: hypothetical protein NUW01_08205 [Gemmatimonadaceae bacterium]|nr:hypothetical protein [Gemmatimonadaceae bacterium]
MTKTQAVKLGQRLVTAGLLESAVVGSAAAARASSAVQGAATIEGMWTGRNSHAAIACEHVAVALAESGRWTVDAIRACRHDFDGAAGAVRWAVPYLPNAVRIAR